MLKYFLSRTTQMFLSPCNFINNNYTHVFAAELGDPYVYIRSTIICDNRQRRTNPLRIGKRNRTTSLGRNWKEITKRASIISEKLRGKLGSTKYNTKCACRTEMAKKRRKNAGKAEWECALHCTRFLLLYFFQIFRCVTASFFTLWLAN